MTAEAPNRAGTVAELWRYPVKSMQGEQVESSAIDENGLAGDRKYAVVDVATGKVGSAKHPRLWGALLECHARWLEPSPGQAPASVAITLPDGGETGSEDPDVDTRLSALFARPVRLTTVAPEGNSYLAVWPAIDGVLPEDFREQNAIDDDEAGGAVTDLSLALAAAPGAFVDVSALHVVTTTTLEHLAELAPDSRFAVQRYRPNIVIGTASAPFAENDWSGATLRVGDSLTAMGLIPTMRCIMTTLAQGGLPRDDEVLRTVARHNRIEIPGLGTWSCVGAYAAVTSSGCVRRGDEIIVDPPG
jgi:hypothetical protein